MLFQPENCPAILRENPGLLIESKGIAGVAGWRRRYSGVNGRQAAFGKTGR
jgi:hypothetical protein